MPDMTLGRAWGVDVPDMAAASTLDRPHDLSCPWVRFTLPWDQIERPNGKFDWSPYLETIRDCHRRGQKTIVVLDGGHRKHTGDPQRLPRKKKEIRAFCGFLEEALEVLGGRGVIWQLLNEPNTRRGDWSALKPEKFCRLVRLAAPLLEDRKVRELLVGPATRGFDWAFLEACMVSNVFTAWHAIGVNPGPESTLADWAQLRILADQHSEATDKIPLWATQMGEGEPERTYLSNLSGGVALSIAPRSLNLPVDGTVDSSDAQYVGMLRTGRADHHAIVFRKETSAHVFSWSDSATPVRQPQSPFEHPVLRYRDEIASLSRTITTSPLASAFAELNPIPAIVSFDRRADLEGFAERAMLPPSQAESLQNLAADLGGELISFDWEPSKLPGFRREVQLVPRRHVSILPYVGQRGWGFAVDNDYGQPIHLEIDYAQGSVTKTACGRIGAGQTFALIPAATEKLHLHDLVSVRLVQGIDPGDPSFVRHAKTVEYRVGYPTEFHLTSGRIEGQKHGARMVWTNPSPALAGELNVLEAEFSLRLGEAMHLIPSPKDEGTCLDDVVAFGLMVSGDRSGVILRMQVVDDSGQTFQFTHGPIDWEGWKYVTFSVDPADHWGGNGEIAWPLYYRAIAVVDAATRKARGTLQFACPTVLVAP